MRSLNKIEKKIIPIFIDKNNRYSLLR